MPNLLPPTFADLNDLTTATKSVVALYGRKADGTLIAIQCDDNGVLASSAILDADVEIGAVELKDADTDTRGKVKSDGTDNAVVVVQNGSTQSFFSDHTVVALNGTFTQQLFGFKSFNISLFNDSGAEVIEFSFNGTNIHGRLKVGEGLSMDYRAQTGIYLRTVSGNPADYRLSAY